MVIRFTFLPLCHFHSWEVLIFLVLLYRIIWVFKMGFSGQWRISRIMKYWCNPWSVVVLFISHLMITETSLAGYIHSPWPKTSLGIWMAWLWCLDNHLHNTLANGTWEIFVQTCTVWWIQSPSAISFRIICLCSHTSRC